MSHADRAEQLRFIIADGARYEHVILGGDMNSKTLGTVAVQTGYAWPTHFTPASNSFGRIDHIFLKGLSPLSGTTAGTVRIASFISDHHPIWATAVLR